MKIAQVCHRYYPNSGGVENHVKEISERLAKKHDVEVITTDLSSQSLKEEEINGVKVKRFSSVHPGDAYYFTTKIFSYLEKKEFDIIHTHNYHSFPAFFASLAKKDRKFIFTPHYHGAGSTTFRDFLNKPYKLFGSMIFKRAEKVISVSNYEKQLIKKDFCAPEVKIELIPNGIALKAIREAKSFDIDNKVILYIGRLEKHKNIQRIIYAMKNLPSDIHFYIGGTGRYENELKRQVKENDLLDRIHFLGFVTDEDKYSWMKTADLFVNLSEIESFGMTTLEALASGTNCLLASSGALRDFSLFSNAYYTRDSKLAFGLLEDRVKELININLSLSTSDFEEYEWDNIAKRIEKVYLEVLGDEKLIEEIK